MIFGKIYQENGKKLYGINFKIMGKYKRNKYICATFNKSLPIFKIMMAFLKKEKLIHYFNPMVNLNEKKYMIKRNRINRNEMVLFQRFSVYNPRTRLATFGTVDYDIPHNFYHYVLQSGLHGIFEKDKDRINLMRKWNMILTNIIGLDNYADIFIETLKELNIDNIYKQSIKIFFNDNTMIIDDNLLKEIIKKNRIQLNYNSTTTYIPCAVCNMRIWDKKQYRKLSKQNKKLYENYIWTNMSYFTFSITLSLNIMKRLNNITHKIEMIEMKE